MQQILEFAGNHTILVAALGAVITFIIVTEVRLRTGARSISAHDAVRKVNDSDATIIDIRESSEYKNAHILNARNIPAARLATDIEEVVRDKTRPIIVYCRSSQRTNDACKTLLAAGYQDVSQLKNGLLGWQDANLPIEK